MKDPVTRIACFAATQVELEDPLRTLRAGRQVEDGPFAVAAGTLYGLEVVVVRTGMGPVNAAEAAERIFGAFTVSEVLVIGFAGGTRPGLETGDLVACSEVVSLSGNEDDEALRRIPSSPALVDRARRTGLISTLAPALTVDRVVSSNEDKMALGCRTGTAVVEMEGFPVLSESYRRGVPGLMVRAVLDPAEMSLPDVEHLLAESGKPRKPALLAHLALHPTHALVFYELFKRAKACRLALSRFFKRYLTLCQQIESR